MRFGRFAAFGRFATLDGFDAALDGERVLLRRRGHVLGRMSLERWRHVALQARASFERLDAGAHAHQVLVCTLFNVEQFLQRRDQLFCVNTRLVLLRSTIFGAVACDGGHIDATEGENVAETRSALAAEKRRAIYDHALTCSTFSCRQWPAICAPSNVRLAAAASS